MISSFKEKFNTQTLKSSKQKHSLLPKLTPRSYINLSRFRKRNCLPVGDRVEYCIANTVSKYWNGTVLGYIHEMS